MNTINAINSLSYNTHCLKITCLNLSTCCLIEYLSSSSFRFPEDKIAALEEELVTKKQSLMKAIDEAQELTDRIYSNLERRNGLCIRCLTKPALTLVLAFLGGSQSPAVYVCKYWYVCCKEWERDVAQSNLAMIDNVTDETATGNEDDGEEG